jgi:hypothetical protein
VSGARARANHKLYLARILLAAWRESLARGEVPATTLDQAFAIPVRDHMIDAYGWFLLEICPLPELPDSPPRNCSELPEMAAGKALPGEVREFMQLEAGGWLADLLAPWDPWAPPRRPGIPGSLNLAAVAPGLPGVETLAQWADELGGLFDRMGDSLDEY